MNRLLIVTTMPVTLRAFLFPFARHFRAKGWRVDAAACGVTSAADCVAEFDRVFDVDWSRSPSDRCNFLRAPKMLHDLVAREDYDIVHVATPVAGFVTRCALRKLRLAGRPKVIYSAHGFHFHPLGSPLMNTFYAGIERFACRYADYVVVTNREDERSALDLRVVEADRLRYINGVGVDTLGAFNPSNVSEEAIAAVRPGLGLTPDDTLFLMAAEFNPGKRHIDAIQATAEVNKTHRAHLALTSSGPLQEEMRALARQLGVEDKVHFMGFVDDFHALVRASRAMILPSIREGLPRSVMDSLSLEVPVIGCSIRGTTELLDRGCGILCPPKDVSALAEAMIRMIEHPEEAEAMGRLGREKMAGYDIRNILRLHEELYAEALDTTGSKVTCS